MRAHILAAAAIAATILWTSDLAQAETSCGPVGCPPQFDQTDPKDIPRYVAGGPFTIAGKGVVACSSGDAAQVANAPDGQFGRAAVSQALSYGGCVDYPGGLRILVYEVGSEVSEVLPDIRDRPGRIKYVPNKFVINRSGRQIDSLAEIRSPKLSAREIYNQR